MLSMSLRTVGMMGTGSLDSLYLYQGYPLFWALGALLSALGPLQKYFVSTICGAHLHRGLLIQEYPYIGDILYRSSPYRGACKLHVPNEKAQTFFAPNGSHTNDYGRLIAIILLVLILVLMAFSLPPWKIIRGSFGNTHILWASAHFLLLGVFLRVCLGARVLTTLRS